MEDTHIGIEKMQSAEVESFKFLFNFVDFMALKCVVELGIADIIHSHNRPITLSCIASSISSSPEPNISYLERIMRLMVYRKIFGANPKSDGGETLYSLTPTSRWLLRNAGVTAVPLMLLQGDDRVLLSWHRLSDCVKEGGVPFEKAIGVSIYNLGSTDTAFNKRFVDAMVYLSSLSLSAIVVGYRDGFECVDTLVDMAGGTGTNLAGIIKANPHIKGINFDQPHTVANAPEHHGVSHVGGNMFESVPCGDAIFIKSVIHNWGDDDCIKILKNCRKAIPKKTGKIIIVDIVINPEGDGPFDETGLVLDLMMLSHTGGKERTEAEFKRLLNEAGFPRYKVIKIADVHSIIEAYPE